MNRAEYMKELAYLLQDVPDGEKEEALQYYEDYFDDAGTENEEQVIAELGRPERLAAIIREGARNGYESLEAEYTENGYRNERYRGPQYEIVPPGQAKKKRLGDGTAAGKEDGTYDWDEDWEKSSEYENGRYAGQENDWVGKGRDLCDKWCRKISDGIEEGRRRMEQKQEERRQSGSRENSRTQTGEGQSQENETYENKSYEGQTYSSSNVPARRRHSLFFWMIFLLGLIFLFPFLLGGAALLFGFTLAVVCAAGGIGLAVIIIAAALLVTGVVFFGVGIGKVFLFPPAGIAFMGAGMILFGLGVLSVWVSITLCGKIIPGAIHMVANFFSFIGKKLRRGGTAA